MHDSIMIHTTEIEEISFREIGVAQEKLTRLRIRYDGGYIVIFLPQGYCLPPITSGE